MGAVYRATQLSLNRTIALKVLSAEFGDDPGFRERFRREGQLQAALDHPHIVTVYEAGETEHGLFLAMRLVRGPTLKDLVLVEGLGRGPRARDPRAGGRRARLGARRRPHPPRRQAPEHPRRRARPRLPGRLRADEGDRGGRADRNGPVHRHDRLRGTRAGPGGAGHEAQRRLLARRRSVRVPGRGGPLLENDRGGRALRAHLRAAAKAQREAAGPPRCDGRGDREGNGEAVRRAAGFGQRADAGRGEGARQERRDPGRGTGPRGRRTGGGNRSRRDARRAHRRGQHTPRGSGRSDGSRIRPGRRNGSGRGAGGPSRPTLRRCGCVGGGGARPGGLPGRRLRLGRGRERRLPELGLGGEHQPGVPDELGARVG